MDSVISDKRGFGGTEEMRYLDKEYCNRNCQRKPDFIEDVLFQKDLYSSYNVIREEPAHVPTYTFADADDSPSTECNPTSLFSEIDTEQPLVVREHGMIPEADCSYVDLAVNDAPQLAINDAIMEGTIDVSDYEVKLFMPVVPEGTDIDLAELKSPHIDNQIVTELDDHGTDEKWGYFELNSSDLLQLSMDAIQMESILETSDNEEVSFMRVDCDNMNVDLLSRIMSGVDKDKVSEPIDRSVDQDSALIDADNSAVMIVNDNAIPTEQTAEVSGIFSDETNREAVLQERNIDLDHVPVPVCTSHGNYKPSVEGQSCSKSRMDDSRDRNRRSQSRSRSHGRCRSPVKSRYHSRRSRSRSVTSNSTNNHRRSQLQLMKSKRYSKDQERRFYSTSSLSSRDGHRSLQSQSKSSERYSRDYSRRTRSRSASVSRSQFSTNSRNADKSSRRPSHINSRDLQRPSSRRNQPRQRSSQHRNFERFSPPLKHHLSSPRPVCRAPA